MRPFFAIAVALALAGCRKNAKDEIEKFALDAVAAARADGGLGPDLVDADLVEQVRRVQLARRTMLDTFDRQALVAVLAGEAGPDRQYPPAERPLRQRERATRGLRAVLSGPCRASRDTDGAVIHVQRMVAPVVGQPEEVSQAMEQLDGALRGVDGAVVVCEHGKVGLVVHRARDGRLKLVDMIDLEKPPIEINPNDPTMK